jgi:short-chain Z-isoprenyl diphosphate synthase
LNVAVGYGGRQEIIDAFTGYLRESFVRQDHPEDILDGVTADSLAKHLYTEK